MSYRFIEITNPPTKLLGYIEGDELDLTGLVLTATTDEGEEEILDNSLVTVDPSPLTLGTTSVTLHYTGEYGEVDNYDFTVVLDGIGVKVASSWKFLDGHGLGYFYSLLLHTFIQKSSEQDYSSEDHYNKVMAYNDHGQVGYAKVDVEDIEYLDGLSELMDEMSEEDRSFESLIVKIVEDNKYVNEMNVMTTEKIESILNDEFV